MFVILVIKLIPHKQWASVTVLMYHTVPAKIIHLSIFCYFFKLFTIHGIMYKGVLLLLFFFFYSVTSGAVLKHTSFYNMPNITAMSAKSFLNE